MSKNYHEMTFGEMIGDFSDNEKKNLYDIMNAFIKGKVPGILEYESWLNNFDYPNDYVMNGFIACVGMHGDLHKDPVVNTNAVTLCNWWRNKHYPLGMLMIREDG